jgi:hypothetical protein
MGYRETKKYKKQCKILEKMRQIKEDKRLASSSPDYPVILPEIRKRITLENFDFGYEKQVMELYKTNRVDCYNVFIEGKLWKKNIGFSRILEFLRKANPRLMSERNL